MSSLKISYFSLIANVQPNLTLPCMVHATQLQNVHQRVGQQMETVQQDLALAVLLRKFIKLLFGGAKGIVVGTSGNWKFYIVFPGKFGYE